MYSLYVDLLLLKIFTACPTFKCWSEQERFVEDYPYVVTRVSVSPEDNDVFAISGKNTKGNHNYSLNKSHQDF